jgi:cyanophycin synthetase
MIMLGSGSRGFIFDPSGLGVGLAVEIPWPEIGRVPVIALTGAAGTTTTARLCAHVFAATGKHVGVAGTEGITIAGETVETGDRANFAGARRVLTDPRVDVAILEVSRESILQQGLGFDVCDVSVIMNVGVEHPDEQPLETLDEMARVQGVIALVTETDGRVVLNATDERLLEIEQYIKAPIMWFSHRPGHPRLPADDETGKDAVWCDGTAIHITWNGAHTQFSRADLPILDGAATLDVESVLAAIAACVALGIDVPSIVEALRTFPPSHL